MITAIVGYMGSGKTLFLTAMSALCKSKIISNYHIKLPNVEMFDLEQFVNGKYETSLCCLDEAYNYLESRLSPSIKNRFFSYMIFQSRKKNLELMVTVQLLNTLDLRFRNLIDIVVYCRGVNEKGFEYDICSLATKKWVKLFINEERAKILFQMYDTNEVIEPEKSPNEMANFLPHHRKDELIDSIVAELLEVAKNTKITRDYIKDYMFRNKLPSNLETFVYTRFKLEYKEEKKEEIKEEVPIVVKKSHKKKVINHKKL